MRIRHHLVVAALIVPALVSAAPAAGLEEELGRNEVRILSERYPIKPGRTVAEIDLAGRLERRGYLRVRRRPAEAGEFFWGNRTFWIYRKAHRHGGTDHPAVLTGLTLRRSDGMILGTVTPSGEESRTGRDAVFHLDPVLLSESADGSRAARILVDLDAMPEDLRRAVLAAEDARFFEHAGVDGRSLARALMANVKAGKVAQGGSTITQQLIKNRDLSPKRSIGRKASEAVRALALEASCDKREILQAYLNSVYLGHSGGLAVHGVGAASQAYFSRPVESLKLHEAALLAAMIQGPNRLHPERHPDRARARRNWVLDRMAEMGWAGKEEAAAARKKPVRIRPAAPRRPPAPRFLEFVKRSIGEEIPDRLERGRGFVAETTIDPHLQERAEHAVRRHLASLRKRYPRLRGSGLSAALVSLDAETGAILAYVGGDPADREDRFDRVSGARRQPGSSIKPLLLLEAFESCGGRKPLHPATRIADEPLRIDLPSGRWEPSNFDGRFHGVVDLRTALRHSYNIPFVRIARHCGEQRTAGRIERTGIELPEPLPPSFALGAVEVTPLEMAGAYTVFSTPGKALHPHGLRRLERPSGRKIAGSRARSRRTVRPSSAWLVRELLGDTVELGTSGNAAIDGVEVAGKTGSSSSLHDAWFVGHAEGLVTAVWVGLDRGGHLGLTGGNGAAPLWRRFMKEAIPARPPYRLVRPGDVVEARIDPRTGLRVSGRVHDGRPELFRKGAMPGHRRIWRRDEPEPVIRD